MLWIQQLLTIFEDPITLLVGESSAERIKKAIGVAARPSGGDGKVLHIKGRDLLKGVPKKLLLIKDKLQRH